jgi:hypothetical protein
MRKISMAFLSFLMFFAAFESNGQIELPAPSPAGTVYSKVGLTDVEISYFRPKMKGRKIFGTGDDYLLQYGQVWRTGANSGTVVSFSDEVSIDGHSIEAGKYLLYAIPGADKWIIGFYKDLSIGGGIQTGLKEEDVAYALGVTPGKRTEPVEVLTINISDISEDNTSAAIEIAWENTSVKVPFQVNFEDKVMASIKANTTVNPQNYVAAANYYYQSGKDPKQALKWITMYFDSNESYQSQFWKIHLMAQIQAATGDIKGAKATAEKSMEIAKNSEGGDFGYIKRNEDFIASLKK